MGRWLPINLTQRESVLGVSARVQTAAALVGLLMTTFAASLIVTALVAGLLVSATNAGAHEAGQRNSLQPGESLEPNGFLVSENGRYHLVLQTDGNLVLYYKPHPTYAELNPDAGSLIAIWNTGTMASSDSNPDRILRMQSDGNLVLYRPPAQLGNALWHTHTYGNPGAYLQLHNSGNLSLSSPDGEVLWEAGNPRPAASETGKKHIVYDVEDQRVWMVEADGSVTDHYPVSGKEGTPSEGRYKVFSKSEDALSYEEGITMRHMVRFTRTEEGANIGFHSIPVTEDGTPLQGTSQLGTYQSAGCIRQRNDKAEQLYGWAPWGTVVLVT